LVTQKHIGLFDFEFCVAKFINGVSHVIVLVKITVVMLEVYMLQQCSVVNLLANCCVWNYTPIKKHDLRIIYPKELSQLDFRI